MEKDIGKLNKNDTTDIVIRIDDFGGRTGLTIREFVTSDRYTGFTKSGVRILAPDFLKFREMINAIDLEDMKDPEGSEGDAPAEQPAEEEKQETSEQPKDQEKLPDY